MAAARNLFATLACALAASGADTFSEGLYPVLQKANCRTCHVENGIAAATRLLFPPAGAPPQEIEAFGRSLGALVDRAQPARSPLLLKPTNRDKHTGGKLISPGSPEESALTGWIANLVRIRAEEKPAEKAGLRAEAETPVVMRRLTHSQYNHTVRDLLGEQTNPASQFPQEDFVNGFKNQAEAQGMPTLLAEAYGAAAERLARNAFRGGDSNRLIPCKPAVAGCRMEFVKTFGLRAFRRPLLDKEVQRYQKLFTQEKEFLKGAQLVVEAMLQSPNFLFRVERPSDPKWRAYETASRLAYFLWDTMPDADLFRKAAQGKLDSRDNIEEAARTMLADGRAKEAFDEFASQWLRFDRLAEMVKDRRLWPAFTPELAAAMTEETRLLLSDVVWNDRDFMTVFTAGYTFLNSDLASFYLLKGPAGEFEKSTYPADSERAGILGHGSFLAMTSKPADTSPTARGLFVREQFLCQHVPDPPPGTNSNLPALTEAQPQTNRQRLGVHLTRETCAGCHKLMDPIGFGFEKFDAAGVRREKLSLTFFPGRKDRKKDAVKVDLDLDTTGSIAGIANSDFSSPKQIGEILARTPQCQECVVRQLFRYAHGRQETAADRPVIQRTFELFRDSKFRVRELLVALATAYAGRG
ncbi:MAG: DUF1592 domain-containing protein [Bryobacterales bacterium]|nr:DUF1592 domain-containing protein [Bryobacterales bacterium]